MKKYILLLLLSTNLLSLSAQVIIKLQLPPSGLSLKSQLWNLSLINTTAETMELQVEMLMTEAATGQRVLSGTSRTLSISKGLLQVTPNNVGPVTYNVLSPEFMMDGPSEGFIPAGAYNVCFAVLAIHGDAVMRLGEECELINVEPLSPPILLLPADNDTLEILHPLFTWLPPLPLSLLNNLSYDFILTEIAPIQSSADAILQNIPLQTQANLRTTNFQYAVSYPELDTNKHYAWQVIAKSNGRLVAKSEVWTFRLKNSKKNTDMLAEISYYAKLKQNIDAGSIICTGTLRYAYLNEINDKTIALKIYDISSAGRRVVKLDQSIETVQYGENFKELDLESFSSLTDKHTYLLEVSNSQNEHWYLKFEYRKSN